MASNPTTRWGDPSKSDPRGQSRHPDRCGVPVAERGCEISVSDRPTRMAGLAVRHHARAERGVVDSVPGRHEPARRGVHRREKDAGGNETIPAVPRFSPEGGPSSPGRLGARRSLGGAGLMIGTPALLPSEVRIRPGESAARQPGSRRLPESRVVAETFLKLVVCVSGASASSGQP